MLDYCLFWYPLSLHGLPVDPTLSYFEPFDFLNLMIGHLAPHHTYWYTNKQTHSHSIASPQQLPYWKICKQAQQNCMKINQNVCVGNIRLVSDQPYLTLIESLYNNINNNNNNNNNITTTTGYSCSGNLKFVF